MNCQFHPTQICIGMEKANKNVQPRFDDPALNSGLHHKFIFGTELETGLNVKDHHKAFQLKHGKKR